MQQADLMTLAKRGFERSAAVRPGREIHFCGNLYIVPQAVVVTPTVCHVDLGTCQHRQAAHLTS
jgi:hypothetical protein